MNPNHSSTPLLRVVRTHQGRYQLSVGLATLDLGPGEFRKLQRLINTAVEDYAEAIAEDACGADMSDRLAERSDEDDPSTDSD